MKPLLLTLLLACTLAASALAQVAIPSIVADGLAAYQENGSQAALTVWLKGSPLENDANASASMNGLFSQIETTSGKMTGYEIIRVRVVAPSFQRVYVLLKFEKGPLYAFFDCYRAKTGWVIPNIDCNAKADLILPPGIFGSPTP